MRLSRDEQKRAVGERFGIRLKPRVMHPQLADPLPVHNGTIPPFRIARPHHPVVRDLRSGRESVFRLQPLIRSPAAPAFVAESTPLLFDRHQQLCTNPGAPFGRENG